MRCFMVSTALKSDDSTALRGWRHLRDLRLLAELAAMRLCRVHRGLHVAFGVGNLAALLISSHARSASAVARAGASRRRRSQRDKKSYSPDAPSERTVARGLNPANYKNFSHVVSWAFSWAFFKSRRALN
jgi:hypothetical protein